MSGTSSAAKASLTSSSEEERINGSKTDKRKSITIIHSQTTKKREDILDCILRGHVVEIRRQGVSDENSMEDGFTTREQINFFESAESIVVDGEIDG